MRVAPAASIARRLSADRIPPDAFTPIDGPTTSRMRATSSTVAPPVEKPVEVLTKSAPAATDRRHAARFSASDSRHVSMITLSTASGQAARTAAISACTTSSRPSFSAPHRNDHVDFLGARRNGGSGLCRLHRGGHRPQRKSDDRADPDIGASQLPCNKWNMDRVHADRSEAMLLCLFAESLDRFLRSIRLEDGVVHQQCDFPARYGLEPDSS